MCMCVGMHVCTYVHTYVCMYVCMYICMYVCIAAAATLCTAHNSELNGTSIVNSGFILLYMESKISLLIPFTYGTAQRQLDSRGYITRVFLSCCTRLHVRVPAYTHAKV